MEQRRLNRSDTWQRLGARRPAVWQALARRGAHCLREIVETAEVVRENGHVYLVARVSSATLDSLATFETSRADLEDGADHEPSVGSDHPIDAEKDTSDDEPDYDNEPKNYLPLALTLAEEE